MLLIAIDSSVGIIGAGKSTLAGQLTIALPNARCFTETVDPIRLEKMYKGLSSGAKPCPEAALFQWWALAARMKTSVEAAEWAWQSVDNIAIVDRYLPSDRAFAHTLHKDGFIDILDYQTYLMNWAYVSKFVMAPHIVIDLIVPPEKCVQRIKERMSENGERESECGVTTEYLERLAKGFRETVIPWYVEHGTKIIKLDWDKYKPIDFVLGKIRKAISPLRI